jgi:hypothetical protein
LSFQEVYDLTPAECVALISDLADVLDESDAPSDSDLRAFKAGGF